MAKLNSRNRSRMLRAAWATGAVALATALFVSATSWEVYRITSPPHLAGRVFGEEARQFGRPLGISLHIALRKIYSVAAFAAVAFAADKALLPTRYQIVRAMLLLGLYSAAIEGSQYLHGVREGIVWNVLDVLCGGRGAWIAIAIDRLWFTRPDVK